MVPASLLSILLVASLSVRAQEPSCPPEHMPAPEHPSLLLRENLQGRVVVAVRLDSCGRVLEASVAESAGHEALDAAAVEAVQGWVFPAAHRALARNGRLKVPIKFDPLDDVETQAFHWPDSHRQARYVEDEQPIEHRTLKAVADAVQTPENLMPSPYVRKSGMTLDPDVPELGGFYRSAAGEQPVYWLSFLRWDGLGETRAGLIRPRQVAVARYRLVSENGAPVVRVGVLCEDDARRCEYIRKLALEPLPIR